MPDKIKLIITQVKEPQTIGDKGAEKLSFKGKDAEGKDYWYFTFSKRLFPSIKELVDKEAEVDVEVSSREWEGNTYWDRKVTEVYVDGKSVAPKSSGGYGGGRGFSIEDRASIEAQVAFKGIIELMTHDVVKKTDKLGKIAIAWATVKMNTKPIPIEENTEEPFTPKPEPQPEITEPKSKPTKAEGNSDSPVDIPWLIESVNKLKWDILQYIKDTYKVETSGNLGDVVGRLSKEQQAELCKEVQDRLDMK